MSSRTTHVLAIVGAVVVLIATAISWYTRDVSFATNVGAVGYTSSKSYALWDLTTVAPVLLVVAAALGAGVLLFSTPGSTRAAAGLAGLLGLAIVAYCVVKCFDLPDFGPTGDVSGFLPVTGVAADAHASTVVNAGPFVGIVGGLMMVAGAFSLAREPSASSTEPRAPSTPSSLQAVSDLRAGIGDRRP
jgi:hypothetical protein